MGYLRVRFISKRLRFSNPNHIIIFLSFWCLLVKEFDFLTVFCFSTMFADKNQVAPRLSLTNVAALNYLLRSEIFVNEDGQLRVVHLILEFEPIPKIFQEIEHANRADDPQLARNDVSKQDFITWDDLPPIILLIRQNPPPLAIPLQQVPPPATIVEEEIASSHLSLEKEIDKFRFKKEEGVPKRPVQLSDYESKSNRFSATYPPRLIVAQVTTSSEEEEEGMDLKQRTSLKGLLANRNKGSISKEAPKT